MKRSHHTPEQIICRLKTAEQLIAQGMTVANVSSWCSKGMSKKVIGLEWSEDHRLMNPPQSTPQHHRIDSNKVFMKTKVA